jgi:hypothetical protein
MMNDVEDSGQKPRSPAGDLALWFVRVLFGLPLAVLGGGITIVFFILLFLYVVSRIGGGPPQTDLLGHFVLWLILGAAPLAVGMMLLNRRTGAPVSGRVFLATLLLLMVVGGDSQCGPKNWHASFRREKLAQGNVDAFKKTFITPHMETEIHSGTNLLWCGTFQLAWNEACKRSGGDLQLAGLGSESPLQHPMAAALNQHAFTRDCIDDASYVAMAGLVKDKMDQKILAAVKDKFHGAFKPRLLPEKYTTGRPQDFVAYACLWKKLSFAVPFERLEDSFTFGGARVRAFGIGRTKASHNSMYSQVQILDYQDEHDFVVELKTTAEGDRLILAQVQPQGTLQNTVTAVRQRVARSQAEPAGTNDVLIVPRIAFDLLREYSEIESRWLVPVAGKVAPDLLLLSALQTIKFEMNEKGVELQSEAHMAFCCAKEGEPPRKHLMIFDQPFLVLLERTGARMPYFALWVDNPELLVPW